MAMTDQRTVKPIDGNGAVVRGGTASVNSEAADSEVLPPKVLPHPEKQPDPTASLVPANRVVSVPLHRTDMKSSPPTSWFKLFWALSLLEYLQLNDTSSLLTEKEKPENRDQQSATNKCNKRQKKSN
ncbi:hypothetical protein ACLB2K_058752 [Fragaria x ananassa]